MFQSHILFSYSSFWAQPQSTEYSASSACSVVSVMSTMSSANWWCIGCLLLMITPHCQLMYLMTISGQVVKSLGEVVSPCLTPFSAGTLTSDDNKAISLVPHKFRSLNHLVYHTFDILHLQRFHHCSYLDTIEILFVINKSNTQRRLVFVHSSYELC